MPDPTLPAIRERVEAWQAASERAPGAPWPNRLVRDMLADLAALLAENDRLRAALEAAQAEAAAVRQTLEATLEYLPDPSEPREQLSARRPIKETVTHVLEAAAVGKGWIDRDRAQCDMIQRLKLALEQDRDERTVALERLAEAARWVRVGMPRYQVDAIRSFVAALDACRAARAALGEAG
jgi:hypothetical protein